MSISLTGDTSNKDVYIKRSYRRPNGKTATQIYKKFGELNDLLDQFSGDYESMMVWAKAEANFLFWHFKMPYFSGSSLHQQKNRP